MVEPKIIAQRAKELISNGWTQGVYARTEDGTVCSYRNEDATCFCLEGALIRASIEEGDESFEGWYKLVKIIQNKINKNQIERNDDKGRTSDEVIELLDGIVN